MSKPVKRFLIGLGKILGLCFAMCIGIYLIAELTFFHGSLIKELLGIRDTHVTNETVKPVVNDIDVVFSDSIPEYIANRGIILRGPVEYYNGVPGYRCGLSGLGIWAEDYVCDCNIHVYSSDEEFHSFCESFTEYDDPFYPDTKHGSDYTCVYGIDRGACQIFRTGMYTDDLSNGSIYMDGDPGYPAPVLYDPTGKYILLLNVGYNESLEDFLLEFLEPEMVKVEVSALTEEGYESTDADEIEKEVDYFHSLELEEVEEEMPELAMAENQTMYSFTDVNGYTNDYTIIGSYLVHGDKIYHILNS